MASRRTAVSHPVSIEHDGQALTAERGEPLAAALVAHGRWSLARSPKLHRPRGPYCFAGACDGCLARVDGEPNVMTCLRRARGGETIETQNVLGARGVDLLRATDFLFPHGLDHHRLFAGVVGVSQMTQLFARRVAGLGTLPDAVLAPRAAAAREADVLVIGAGRSGLELAAELGSRALLLERAPQAGGAALARDPAVAHVAVRRALDRGATLELNHTVVGLYRDPPDTGPLRALVIAEGGATVVTPRQVVLATGHHAGPAEFENNDLPGVISARAALELWRCGVSLGARVAVVGASVDADAWVALAGDACTVLRFAPSSVLRVSGLSSVRSITVREGDAGRRIKVDCVVCVGTPTPALELAVQAGARVAWTGASYAAERDGTGRVAAHTWLVGSAAGGAGPDAARVALALD